VELSEENFEQEVLKSNMPVVVDYWAKWCNPCKMVAPMFERLSRQIDSVKFAKVNVDESTQLAHVNGVLGIPCIIVYNKGEEVERIVGFQTEEQLKQKLTKALQSL